MTAAARATRNGAVGIATREALTMAGVCHPGDVLGVLEGDVALIGSDVAEVSQELLDRMLRAGGELVTLIAGAGTNSELTDMLNAHVHRRYGGVDVTAYEGGQKNALLIIGVE